MTTRHSYYVVMQDFGRRGFEANVHPEETKADIIDMLRSKDHFGPISFIHFIEVDEDGRGTATEVTNELLAESGFYNEAAE